MDRATSFELCALYFLRRPVLKELTQLETEVQRTKLKALSSVGIEE